MFAQDEASLRDAKGKSRGEREFLLAFGPGKLQNNLIHCNPYLVDHFLEKKHMNLANAN